MHSYLVTYVLLLDDRGEVSFLWVRRVRSPFDLTENSNLAPQNGFPVVKGLRHVCPY